MVQQKKRWPIKLSFSQLKVNNNKYSHFKIRNFVKLANHRMTYIQHKSMCFPLKLMKNMVCTMIPYVIQRQFWISLHTFAIAIGPLYQDTDCCLEHFKVSLLLSFKCTNFYWTNLWAAHHMVSRIPNYQRLFNQSKKNPVVTLLVKWI